MHVTALEQLSAQNDLPANLRTALWQDFEYARFGAVFPDLATFDGYFSGAGHLFLHHSPPTFVRIYHRLAPVSLGLKMAELVFAGALVGRTAGLAFVSGYFSHICIDRVMQPLMLRPEIRIQDAAGMYTRQYLRQVFGQDLMGTPLLQHKLQISKSVGFPFRGVSRGLYELIRMASEEIVGQAPTKRQVDGWVRGLYLYAKLIGSPMSKIRRRALPSEAWEGTEVASEMRRALLLTRDVLSLVSIFTSRGNFSRLAKEKFLKEFPEGPIDGYGLASTHSTH